MATTQPLWAPYVSESTGKEVGYALAAVAQWIDCQPVNPGVTSSVPNQGTCLGYRPDPQLGMHKRQPHIDVSLPLFLSLPLSLKMNK